MDIDKTKQFVGEKWDSTIIPTLSEYISIPNQSPSFDPEWATNGHLDKVVTLFTNWVKAQNVPGLTLEVVRIGSRTPIIFMEVAGTKSTPGNVMLYGHMDKQPPLESSWDEGLHPYKPVIKDGKLYGRGGADDGYAVSSNN